MPDCFWMLNEAERLVMFASVELGRGGLGQLIEALYSPSRQSGFSASTPSTPRYVEIRLAHLHLEAVGMCREPLCKRSKAFFRGGHCVFRKAVPVAVASA